MEQDASIPAGISVMGADLSPDMLLAKAQYRHSSTLA